MNNYMYSFIEFCAGNIYVCLLIMRSVRVIFNFPSYVQTYKDNKLYWRTREMRHYSNHHSDTWSVSDGLNRSHFSCSSVHNYTCTILYDVWYYSILTALHTFKRVVVFLQYRSHYNVHVCALPVSLVMSCHDTLPPPPLPPLLHYPSHPSPPFIFLGGGGGGVRG